MKRCACGGGDDEERGEKEAGALSYRLGVQGGGDASDSALLALPCLQTEVKHTDGCREQKRGGQRGRERERREWAKIHRHRRLLVCREDEVTRTRGVEIKEGGGGERESPCVLGPSFQRLLYPCEPEGCRFT